MRLALGVLMAGVAFMVARGRSRERRRNCPPQYYAKQCAVADIDHGRATTEQPVAAALPTPLRQECTDDGEHKREERRYWKLNYVATSIQAAATAGAFLFAASAFVATWRAMEAAQEQARTAREALVAADRPWLKIERVSVAEVSMNPLGATIKLSVKAKNIGRSPALRGLALIEVMPDMGDGEPARLAAPLCRRAAADRDLAEVEGVVFPDADRETHYVRFVLPSDARAAMNRVSSPEASGGRDRSLEATPKTLQTRIAIVGCATYTFQDGRAVGQTAFVYDLARNCGPPPQEWPCGFDLSENGAFSGDEIVVREADFAGFAR